MSSGPQFKIAEFFAGIGLVRMGLESAGGRVVFANDIDPKKLEMYAHHFGDASEHFVLGDIFDLDPALVPKVEVATASFPCTDLSLAGARKGLSGAQSSAFWGFISIMENVKQKPQIVLLENVTGFLTSRGGADFREALIALNSLGYAVDPFMLDAAWFVPQSRQRLFVVGTLMQSGRLNERRSQYSFWDTPIRPRALSHFIEQNDDIIFAIRDLPIPGAIVGRIDELIEDLSVDAPEWWSEDRVNYLLAQMSEKHLSSAIEMKARDHLSYGTVFRRVRNGKSMAELRLDGIAGCLRTPKGGSGRQILLQAGKGEIKVRLLTARECARLMGADDYRLNVPLNQALFGFGDGVCVPAIKWIAENYFIPELTGAIHA